tara:strand:+ start:317 stop:595 length:279 start_codon:yes stop_codon:yes gene_type:complete
MRDSSRQKGDPEQKYHIKTRPFKNLSVHSGHPIIIDIDAGVEYPTMIIVDRPKSIISITMKTAADDLKVGLYKCKLDSQYINTVDGNCKEQI